MTWMKTCESGSQSCGWGADMRDEIAIDPLDIPAGPDRLEALIDAGRVTHHAWRDTDAEGRERLCWLAALSDEVAEERDASACSSQLMPSWLAHLVPSMDYGVSDGYREEAGRRLVSTVRSLGALSAEASERGGALNWRGPLMVM